MLKNTTSKPSTWRYIAIFLVFLAMFPNIVIFGFYSLGIQPNLLIASAVLFPLFFNKSFSIELWIALFVFFFSLVVLFFSSIDFNSFRSIGNYLSIFIIPFVLQKLLFYIDTETFKKIIKVGIWIWLTVGLIQLFIDPVFLGFLLPHISGSLSDGRGVCSLATEPTNYGYNLCFFLIIVIGFFSKKEKYAYVVLILFQLLFLSRSSTSLASLLISFGVLIFFSSIKNIIIISFSVFIIGFLGLSYIDTLAPTALEDSRVLSLTAAAVKNPQDILILDGSGNRRFIAIFFSIKGCFDNYGYPRGYNQFDAYMDNEGGNSKFSDLISYLVSYDARIQSSIGGILFELGFLGGLIILSYYYTYMSSLSMYPKYGLILTIILLLNPVPFSHSLLALTIAYHLYRKKTRTIK
jgi:hypothetical protein